MSRITTRDQRGSAVITVMLIMLVLSAIALLLVSTAVSEMDQSGRTVRMSAAFQAAEAAIDDYIAKLTEDHQYYAHFVHPAEATRRGPGGQSREAGTAWTGETTWTYPSGKNAWRALGNGYEYNLEIISPTAASGGAVRVFATGRRVGTSTEWRTIEALVRPASVVDFQMIANADIAYGSTASTYGKIYAGIDASGHAHNIAHDGKAYADVYAEGSITGQLSYRNGALGYDSRTIRNKIKNPVNFNSFTGSLVDVQRAATAGGLVLSNSSVDGWRLVFSSNGTVTVSRCVRRNRADIADQQPTCTSPVTYNLPVNGAIYSTQSVIVSGTVTGRVTVVSNSNVVVGGNLSYNQPGTDVIGLIARQDMIVARWVPTNLTWSAATIAQNGAWRSFLSAGDGHGTMTFNGSTATNLGGYMSMFNTRVYNYDTNLLYVQPPYFPVLEEAYTILFFREVPS